MATQYVIFHQEEKRFHGAPVIFFNSQADADVQISRLTGKDKHRKNGPQTYQKVAVTV
jgi:hypothetical protein